MPTIDVNHSSGRYSIVIESGLLARLGEMVRSTCNTRRTMLAMDANIAASHGEVVVKSLHDAGFEVCSHHLVADESNKSLDAVRAMYDAMLHARLERSSCVIALGGGIVGDVAGFAAASYLRGVPIVQVPTTLLAMVDASIGGKTGVNLPLPDGTLGKNLVGAFWQPIAVVVDPQVLRTLDARQFRCGLAECVKHGMIADVSLLNFIAENVDNILAHDDGVLMALITRSVSIKAGIVQIDEREAGERALLNLGHTFAHAFESIKQLQLLHGEAVAVGLVAAVHIAVQTQRMRSDEGDQIRALIDALGLPVRLPRSVAISQLMHAMAYDKKKSTGKLRFILPMGREKGGGATIVDDVPLAVIESALVAVGAHR